jgi:hypothetical protein
MYGKYFASTFTGSMAGAGLHVFSVWGYVIANAWDAQVEINPVVVAAMLGTEPEDVTAALEVLCAPDPKSRTVAEDGRRLIHLHAFLYRVVNHEVYRGMRNEEERRAYNRDAKRRERAKKAVKQAKKAVKRQSVDVKRTVNDMSNVSATVSHSQPSSAQAEGEAEVLVPPDVLVARSAPAKKLTDPHRRHVFCGRSCVTQVLHTQFLKRRHHRGADAELRSWYADVDGEWTTGAHSADEPGDEFDFWRDRYAEHWPANGAVQPIASAASYRAMHLPACPHVEPHRSRKQCSIATERGDPERES